MKNNDINSLSSACILVIGNEILSGRTEDKNINFKEFSDSTEIIVISDADIIRNDISNKGIPLPLGYDKYINYTYDGNKKFILNAIQYCVLNTSKPVVRKQVFIHFYDWFKSWVSKMYMELGMLNLLRHSPIPSTHAFSPNIKNGTSAPKPKPRVINSFFDIFILANLFIPNSIVAASELPPPKPDPIGMFFLI